MSRAQQLTERWRSGVVKALKNGMLCYGCGYRVPAGQWLNGPSGTTFYCPFCYTSMAFGRGTE